MSVFGIKCDNSGTPDRDYTSMSYEKTTLSIRTGTSSWRSINTYEFTEKLFGSGTHATLNHAGPENFNDLFRKLKETKENSTTRQRCSSTNRARWQTASSWTFHQKKSRQVQWPDATIDIQHDSNNKVMKNRLLICIRYLIRTIPANSIWVSETNKQIGNLIWFRNFVSRPTVNFSDNMCDVDDQNAWYS